MSSSNTFARDLWAKHLQGSPDAARKVILDLLKPSAATALAAMTPEQFNAYFGTRHASKTSIETPGHWRLLELIDRLEDDDELMRAARFKWAFNVKPDIVVHASNRAAVCVEAKVVSEEGLYPDEPKEKRAWKARGLPLVRQIEVQRYVMAELLGLDVEHVYVVQRRPPTEPSGVRVVTWRELFAALDTSRCAGFVADWIARY